MLTRALKHHSRLCLGDGMKSLLKHLATPSVVKLIELKFSWVDLIIKTMTKELGLRFYLGFRSILFAFFGGFKWIYL